MLSLGYGYNANGHLSALTYPDGHTVTYAPDALGRATQVADSTGPVYASAIGYYPNGAIAQFTYGNGIVHTLTKNLRQLPTRSQDASATVTVLDDTYAFDANGNVTDITDQAQAGLTTRGMAYDGLDRLTAAVSLNQWGSATYSYDALDNIRSADQGARQHRYGYDPVTNRLTDIQTPAGATVFSFGYDANGNTTSKNAAQGCASGAGAGCAGAPAQTYAFDSANRLNAVTGLQSYRYEAQDVRVPRRAGRP